MDTKRHRPLNLSALGENLALTLQWRVSDNNNIRLSMLCGDGCSGAVQPKPPIGQWTTTTIPLACFVQAGLKPESLTTPLHISGGESLSITLHNAKLTPTNVPGCGGF